MKQMAIIGGMDPEWAEIYGDFATMPLLEGFAVVTVKGVQAIKNLKTGEIIYSKSGVAGSGVGNLTNKASGGAKGIREGLGKSFKSQALFENHYVKHGAEMQKALGKSSYSSANYLTVANHVIQNGTYVPELNGYVKFISGQKHGFVGLDRATGDITTFHIKTVSELIKNAPSLGLGK